MELIDAAIDPVETDFDSLIEPVEAPIDFPEAPIDFIEAPIDFPEAPIHLIEAPPYLSGEIVQAVVGPAVPHRLHDCSLNVADARVARSLQLFSNK